MVRNELVAELSLLQADTIAVRGALGEVTLTVAEQSIRVLASSCPQQVCVRQGRIHRVPQMLVCVPNHLVIVLSEQKGNALDAVTF